MYRFIKPVALCLLAALFSAACAAPAPDVSDRKKLWDDGVYITIKRHGDEESVQCLVYDNYGDVVARYYDLDENDRIVLNENSDLILCQDYKGAFNIFSYESLDYVIDESYPFQAQPRLPGDTPKREWDWEMQGSVLIFTEDGVEKRYTLPIDGGTHRVYNINDSMVRVDDSLILYQSGTILRNQKSGPSMYWGADLNKGYAIMTEWYVNEKLHRDIVLDNAGKTLWQGEWKEMYINAEGYELKAESSIEVADGALILCVGNKSYRVDVLEDAEILGVYLGSLNENVVSFWYQYRRDGELYSNVRLIRYKTGEDLSALLDDTSVYSPDDAIFRNYILIQHYGSNWAPYTGRDYTILDGNGILISRGDGYLYYMGHDLFELHRGNYYGVVNAKGEWLLRLLAIGED